MRLITANYKFLHGLCLKDTQRFSLVAQDILILIKACSKTKQGRPRDEFRPGVFSEEGGSSDNPVSVMQAMQYLQLNTR